MKKIGQPMRSFRLVCLPEHIPLVEALLRAEGYDFAPEPFSPWCRILAHEPAPLGASLAALFGCIYIQDRSSMLPPLALNPPQGAAVLDMCASPGGKTSFCAQLAGSTGFVLGNEPTRTRLGTLRANLASLGLLHVGTCAYPGERIPLRPASWDYILLDPPCSGWGTALKHPEVKALWRGDKIKPLAALQRRLLERAAQLLTPGGVLSYSTCTTNEDENEAQVRYAREELGLIVEPLAPFDGFVWETPRPGGEGTLRVDGEQSNAQGFYSARLRAPGAPPLDDTRPHTLTPNAANLTNLANLASLANPAAQPAQPIMTLTTLPPQALDAPCCTAAALHGTLAVFGDTARLVPPQAMALLPEGFQWQAAAVGRVAPGATGVRVRPGARQRSLLPCPPPENAVVASDTATLRALCNGQSVHSSADVRETGLYWRELPLGRVSVKSGRVIWNPNL